MPDTLFERKFNTGEKVGTMTRVLVIDDSEDLRLIVQELLLDMGIECTTAEDTSSAMQALDEQRFDVILCDLVLPVEDDEEYDDDEPPNTSAMVGVHAINKISKNFPHVPVVAISGALTGGPLQAIQQFGAMTTLSKPFGKEELQAVIEYALIGNRPHA